MNFYSKEIDFLKEEENRVVAKMIDTVKRSLEENQTVLAELMAKFLRIWSTIDAYRNFANQKKEITDDNTNDFVVLVNEYYSQRCDKLKEDIIEFNLINDLYKKLNQK